MSDFVYTTLPVDDLRLPSYRYGRRLRAAFDRKYCGTVVVNRRDGDKLYVVDGWARVEAARAAGVTELSCAVTELPLLAEQRLFRAVNGVAS